MDWRVDRILLLVIMFLAGGVVMLELRPEPMVSVPPARSFNDRPTAQAVPAAWSRFAQHAMDQFKMGLDANDGTAGRFRLFLKNRGAGGDPEAYTLPIAVWIGADGKVARLDFPPLRDPQAEADLHRILEGREIGPPPSDMPQPLRLKLALKGSDGA
jgi:hypothetical protein